MIVSKFLRREKSRHVESVLEQTFTAPFTSIPSRASGIPSRATGYVRLTVFNLLGQEVARLYDGTQQAGTYEVGIARLNLPSGIYFYRLIAPGFRRNEENRRLTLTAEGTTVRVPAVLSTQGGEHMDRTLSGLCTLDALVLPVPPPPGARRASRSSTPSPASHSTFPVFLTHAGDGTNRIFVVQQDGNILVFPNDSAVAAATTFLNITPKAQPITGEEGLLGLAFHPEFKTNGYFYVNYTAPNPLRTVVARYRVPSGGLRTGQTPRANSRSSRSTSRSRTTTGGCYRSGPTGTCTSGWGTAGTRTTLTPTDSTGRRSSERCSGST